MEIHFGDGVRRKNYPDLFQSSGLNRSVSAFKCRYLQMFKVLISQKFAQKSANFHFRLVKVVVVVKWVGVLNWPKVDVQGATVRNPHE